MIDPWRKNFLAVLLLFGLLSLFGCGGEHVPVQPAARTGSVFQFPMSEVQTATRNALTHLGFAITKESPEYMEAIRLKPGETLEANTSELVGVWFQARDQYSTLVLTNTALRSIGIATQKEWDQALIARIRQELP
jgi:hypothetical protein